MAAPAVNSSIGHAGDPTTAPTITLSTTAANDILILVRVNGGSTALAAPGGTYSGGAWTTIDSGTWTTGAGAVMWSRCTGNHNGQTITAVTVDSGSMQVSRITGAITTGAPIGTTTGTTLGAVNGGALTGFSTTAIDTLVCYTGAVDDNQNIATPTMGGSAMTNDSANSTGGNDSAVWFAYVTKAVAGATGDFAITNNAGTAEGKRVSAFAVLSVRSVILGASSAQSAATLDLTTPTAPVTTGTGVVQLAALNPPGAGTQTLAIRARAASGSGTLRTTLYDSDGVTSRGTADFTLTGSFQTFTLNPSGITSYSGLKVGFEGRSATALTAEVSWIELRIPYGAPVAYVALDPSAGTSTATVAISAATQVVLGASAAGSTASLDLSIAAAAVTVALGSSVATSSSTLALRAPTQVALQSVGAVSAPSLALAAPTRLPLGTSAAQSTATLALTAPTVGFTVVLSAPAATSTATLALKRPALISLASSAQTTGFLAVTRPTNLLLSPSTGIATASTFAVGPGPAATDHPTLGGVFNEAPRGGEVGLARFTLLYPGTFYPGEFAFPSASFYPGGGESVFYTGLRRSGDLDEQAANGTVVESIHSAALSRIASADLPGSRGGIFDESLRGGLIDEGRVGADESREAAGLFDESVRGSAIEESRHSGDDERVTAGVVEESNRDGDVY